MEDSFYYQIISNFDYQNELVKNNFFKKNEEMLITKFFNLLQDNLFLENDKSKLIELINNVSIRNFFINSAIFSGFCSRSFLSNIEPMQDYDNIFNRDNLIKVLSVLSIENDYYIQSKMIQIASSYETLDIIVKTQKLSEENQEIFFEKSKNFPKSIFSLVNYQKINDSLMTKIINIFLLNESEQFYFNLSCAIADKQQLSGNNIDLLYNNVGSVHENDLSKLSKILINKQNYIIQSAAKIRERAQRNSTVSFVNRVQMTNNNCGQGKDIY